MLRARLLQAARQADVVHGVDPVEKDDRLTGLVGLEVADHVPARAREVAERRDLGLGLLDLVLAEVPQPGGEGLAHLFGGMGLGHGHERDLVVPATRAGGRPGDPLPDGGHAVSDHFLGSAPSSAWAVVTFVAFSAAGMLGFSTPERSPVTTAAGV